MVEQTSRTFHTEYEAEAFMAGFRQGQPGPEFSEAQTRAFQLGQQCGQQQPGIRARQDRRDRQAILVDLADTAAAWTYYGLVSAYHGQTLG